MSSVETAVESSTDAGPLATDLPRRLVIPVVVSGLAVVVVLLVIVGMSTSAWQLLGVGRGLVPPEYYPVSGFLVVLATTLGQAVGWAGGSGIACYVLTHIGFRSDPFTWKLAMSIVYVGLGGLPLLVYHVLFGAPLLAMPRVGLESWLLEQYPDAHWLLVSAHPVVDWSLIPLGVIFLALLWFTDAFAGRSRVVETVLALALLGTSLAVALSLAIHSTLAHIKFLP